MFRLKTLKYALPMVAFLAVSAISSTPAKAEWQHAWSNGDGVTLWYNSDTDKFAVTIEKDGKFGVWFDEAVVDAVMDKMDGSNPNPDDPNNGKGTSKPDIVAMLKQAEGASWSVKVNPEDSPMGGVINGDGGGKVPHWNPGGDESGNPTPKSGDGKSAIERYNEEQKAKLQHALEVAAREAGKSGMGMFDGSEGGSESWGGLKPHGGIKTGDGKGKDDDGENKDGSDFRDPYMPKGEDLGAKPEIVNPTPDGKKGGRTTVTVKVGGLGSGGTQGLDLGKKGGGGGDQGGKSGKGSTQGLTFNGKGKGGGGGDQGGKADRQVTNVMSPGLLDGGNGLAFNGPAGAGGHGGATAMRGGR